MGSPSDSTARGSAAEVFWIFLKLGLTSFGGPIAHLGYFRRELIERRGWLDDGRYAQLIALCQFLPGPASSQLGFSMGLLRAGWRGAFAAFAAFTLPSALLMMALASFLPQISGVAGDAAMHGLKLVALPIVAYGLIGMARQLCPDTPRRLIAIVAAVVILLSATLWTQMLAIVLGALAGAALCNRLDALPNGQLHVRYGTRLGWLLLGLFLLLLIGLTLATSASLSFLAATAAFYRAGALVFGGGHVVLPLLEQAVVAPGWMSADEFLLGYGAAQAVPGPMFTLAAYLGARLSDGVGGPLGAGVALIAIFLPGLLLVAGTLPLWRSFTAHPSALRAMAGVNASVVGLLLAALYDPIWINSIAGLGDVAIAAVGLVLLNKRISALLVVLWCVTGSMAVAALS